ncbi:nitroreductase [candidate division KSB1 bacterium]|nr:MAG: nitroreductase [candidate division KSB1 bacterium]
MEFYNVIKTRRSVRSYKDEKVPAEVVRRVLDAARLAPSANNTQPWRFIVVENETTRKELGRLASNQMFIAEAPIIIVCCGEKYRDPWSWIGENMYLVDVTIAIDHLTLAARNEGLGTCWIGAFDHSSIKKLLGIPKEIDVIALTPLGYPRNEAAFTESTRRKHLSEITFKDKYGEKFD